jgi:hypothetical protein
MLSFMQYTRTRNNSTFFCINYPDGALHRLKKHLQRDPALAFREYFLDALAAADCMAAWKSTISRNRRVLVDLVQLSLNSESYGNK